MNVRFSDGAIRLRVTREELDALLAARAVALVLSLPRDHRFRVNVRSAPVGGWQLDSDPTGLWLTIPRGELQALAQRLPSKEGIGQSFETADAAGVRVTFEVDLRR